MYLAPDGDEIEIANAAGSFLAESMPISRLHKPDGCDMSAALRVQMADMGWFALAVPEASGGSGLSAVEHALFFREAGRQCGPVDLLAQCLGANFTSDSETRAALLAGDSGVALVIADGGSWRILGASDSHYGLIVTPQSAELYVLGSVPTEARSGLDPAVTMRVARKLPAPIECAADKDVWRFGQLGAAAMLVGIAEAALEMIVEYAKVREAFGRKIGAFQAVRHPCADMAMRVESSRAQLWYAAAALKEKRADADVHLNAAKHIANQAALANVDVNIQLHGGIGVTDEHNAHLLLKHALLLSRLFGSKRYLLSRLLNARLED